MKSGINFIFSWITFLSAGQKCFIQAEGIVKSSLKMDFIVPGFLHASGQNIEF